jgi:hypothetical protein
MNDVERELKRQTKMMAETRADKIFVAGVLWGIIILMFAPMVIPLGLSMFIKDNVPWWGYVAFPFVFGGIFSWLSYREMVNDGSKRSSFIKLDAEKRATIALGIVIYGGWYAYSYFTSPDNPVAKVAELPPHQQRIDGGDFILKCQKAAKSEMEYPATVSFPLWRHELDHAPGHASYRVRFSAKNGLNVPVEFDLVCSGDWTGKIDYRITPATYN